MVERYFNLKDVFPKLQTECPDLAPFFLSVPEDHRLSDLFEKTLVKLQSVTLALQKDSLTLAEVRVLFDQGLCLLVMNLFPFS
jgi:hypothetical protein